MNVGTWGKADCWELGFVLSNLLRKVGATFSSDGWSTSPQMVTWPVTVWGPLQEGHGNIVWGDYGEHRCQGQEAAITRRPAEGESDACSSREPRLTLFVPWAGRPLAVGPSVCTRCCISTVLSFLGSFIQRQRGQPFCCEIWDTLGQNLAKKKKKSTFTNPTVYKVEVLTSLDQGPW